MCTELGWTSRKIGDLPQMSDIMFHFLEHLNIRDDVGFVWLPLDGVHKATINAAIRHDWIIGSDGLDGTKYRLTGRGASVLRIYSIPVTEYRFDGICPNCGERPVAFTEKGQSRGYCRECIREFGKRRYKRRGRKYSDRPCPQCGIRKVHTTTNGFTHAYCLECKRKNAKAERQRKHERKLARIAAGEFIPCVHCKEQPVYHTSKTVYDYCYDCYRNYQNEYNRRRFATLGVRRVPTK